MRKKKKIDQTIIDNLSNFLIQEFLEYYPFYQYKFLSQSVRELYLDSFNFDMTVDMLESTSVLGKEGIENTLWIATIRQRLFFKITQLGFDKKTFKEINVLVKSVYKHKEKYIEYQVVFKDNSKHKYQGKIVKKEVRRRNGLLTKKSWVEKAKTLFK